MYNTVLEAKRNLGSRLCCAFSLIRRRSVVIATVRTTAKKILGPRVTAYLRSLRIKNLPNAGRYRHLRGRSALEIGGPSEIFAQQYGTYQ